MSKVLLFLSSKPPLLILFTQAAALADFGEDSEDLGDEQSAAEISPLDHCSLRRVHL